MDNWFKDYAKEPMKNDMPDVDGATSMDDCKWEMRVGGIAVVPQIGDLVEVWENVTVEVIELPDGTYDVGWRRQPNSSCIYKKGELE